MIMEPEIPDVSPEKNETNGSPETTVGTSTATSKQIRQFRSVNFKSGSETKILSARTGKPVTISLKNLNNYQKSMLSNTCDFIDSKLKGSIYEEQISILMKVTGFFVTSSNHLGAYSFEQNSEPFVIFNGKTIVESNEFAVTVLHELLHLITEPGDGDPASLYEAEHDFLCYSLLGIPVHPSHWALTKYPHLKDKLLSVSGSDKDL